MKLITILTVFCVLISDPVFPQQDMKTLHYLEGKWIIEEDGTDIHEEWTKVNDTLLTAVSYYVKNGDTTNTETVRLEKIGKDIFYIPMVEHNPGPVKFKLTSLTKNKAVFENPGHDFPTKIIYERINYDSLHARIEGMQDGKLEGIDYPFKRVK